jgi:4-hydroxybenzoate polyprenyltransferase
MQKKDPKINPYVRAMRLDRWPRSLAIYAGSTAFVFLHKDLFLEASVLSIIIRTFLAFLLTWGISTANYIVNEIADAPHDIHHPIKKKRPLIKGEIDKTHFIMLGLLITLVCLVIAGGLFRRAFTYSLLALLIAGFIYNINPIRTKDIPFLDSISESANNPIRFFIGWFAFSPDQIFPPLTLIFCWWAFGNYLLVAKRLSEFHYLKDKAGDYRASLRRYSEGSLIFGMICSACVFFAAYILFAFMTSHHLFLYLSPLLLFYFYLIFRKTMKEKGIMEEPERLLKNPGFAAYTLLLLILFLITAYLSMT